MRTHRSAVIGAVASAALLCSAAAGFAQSPGVKEHGRVIEVPPGAVVLVLPGGFMPTAGVPATSFSTSPFSIAPFDVGFPVPTTMIQQMNQMMAELQHDFANPMMMNEDRTIEAAMRNLPQTNGPMSSVTVTSYSDGHGTCTQRVTYTGSMKAPRVLVSSTGDACARVHMPTVTTDTGAPLPTSGAPHLIHVRDRQPAAPAPHLIQADDRAPAAPLVYAQAAQ